MYNIVGGERARIVYLGYRSMIPTHYAKRTERTAIKQQITE